MRLALLAALLVLSIYAPPAKADYWSFGDGRWYTASDPSSLCTLLLSPVGTAATARGYSNLAVASFLSASPSPIGSVSYDDAVGWCVYSASGASTITFPVPVFDRNLTFGYAGYGVNPGPYDVTRGLGLFSFAFGTVLTFWLGSHGVGILLAMIRRGR